MDELASFLRRDRDQIVAEWLAHVSRLPASVGLSESSLSDHIPELVDGLADGVARGDSDTLEADGIPSLHAAERFRAGYDLRQVVAEYREIRSVICERYRQQVGARSPLLHAWLEPIATLHAAIDGAIADAVDHHAVERDRAREVFVAILGHDLRNPLSAITMAATQLLDGPEGLAAPNAARLVSRVVTSAARIERMIRDLLDFAHGRLGAGLPVLTTAIDLRPVVRDTVDELAQAYPQRDIKWIGADAADLRGVFDADRMAQAVSNLVGNAIQHGADPISIDALDRGDQVVLEVSSGGEIAHDRLTRLFDPYFSTGEATARGRSLGLGLFIVKEIARAHGGRIEVDSSVERGTCFRLWLPRTR